MNDKPKFETLKTAVKLDKGRNQYFVSTQKITQPSGSSSDHLVIKKQPYNDDGSPQGNSKQLFIPLSDSEALLKHVSAFIDDKK